MWKPLFAAIALLGMGAVFSVPFLTRSNNTKSETGLPLRDLASDPTNSNPNFSPEAGFEYIYSFKREIEIKGLGANKIPINYGGEFDLQVEKTEPQGFWAYATVDVSGHRTKNVGMKIFVKNDGSDLRFYSNEVASAEDGEIGSIIKDLSANLIFPLKRDTTGPYSANLVWSKNGKIVSGKKVKSSYQMSLNAPQILESYHIASWKLSAPLPDEVAGKDVTRIGDSASSLFARNSYQLRFVQAKKSIGLAAEKWQQLSHEEDLLPSRGAKKVAAVALDWAEVRSRLENIAKLSNGEQLQLFSDIAKLLQGGKVSTADLLAILRQKGALKEGASSPLFQNIVGALATAGDEKSQAALLEIYAEAPKSGKGSVLAAFTTSEAPASNSTKDFLAEVMEQESDKDLSQGAGYAFGSALASSNNSSDADRIFKMWHSLSNSDVNGKLAVLDIMGNSGRDEFFPVLEIAAKSATEPEEVRAKAIFSLRYIKSARARALLVTAMNFSSVRVRGGAVHGVQLAEWTESFRAPLASCALKDPVQEIRSACGSIIARESQKVAGN